MLEILGHVPLFVWPLFILLLVGGLRARKTNSMPLPILFVIPALFGAWSLFNFFGKYGSNVALVCLWLLCLGTGFSAGFAHIQKMVLRFDKRKKMVELPGSWIPLILSLSIFTSKFSINMIISISPHLSESILLLSLELFATTILGIFLGRGVGCLVRYRASSANVV
jgi:hypothetical protein